MMRVDSRKLVLIGIFLISATFLFICRGHAQAGKKLIVFVSIPPQKYFLHQIGKQRTKGYYLCISKGISNIVTMHLEGYLFQFILVGLTVN